MSHYGGLRLSRVNAEAGTIFCFVESGSRFLPLIEFIEDQI